MLDCTCACLSLRQNCPVCILHFLCYKLSTLHCCKPQHHKTRWIQCSCDRSSHKRKSGRFQVSIQHGKRKSNQPLQPQTLVVYIEHELMLFLFVQYLHKTYQPLYKCTYGPQRTCFEAPSPCRAPDSLKCIYLARRHFNSSLNLTGSNLYPL